MKKMNNKGFTLAELLIVIAIIAILIGIAIPAFSGALTQAKLQTDHANIRSAYAVYKSGELLGDIPELHNASGTIEAGTYIFQKDGTIVKDGTANAYALQADGETNACKTSIPCATSGAHAKDNLIKIIYDDTAKTFTFSVSAP